MIVPPTAPLCRRASIRDRRASIGRATLARTARYRRLLHRHEPVQAAESSISSPYRFAAIPSCEAAETPAARGETGQHSGQGIAITAMPLGLGAHAIRDALEVDVYQRQVRLARPVRTRSAVLAITLGAVQPFSHVSSPPRPGHRVGGRACRVRSPGLARGSDEIGERLHAIKLGATAWPATSSTRGTRTGWLGCEGSRGTSPMSISWAADGNHGRPGQPECSSDLLRDAHCSISA